MTDCRTLEEVAATEHTTPLRLLRFCKRNNVPVYRISRDSPWMFHADGPRILANVRASLPAAKEFERVARERRNAAVAQIDIVLLAQESILAAARRWDKYGCGIYFLISRKKIIYVGQSKNVLARVHRHRDTKQFTSWHWIPCRPGMLNAMERAYLDAFMPELNRDPKTHRLRSSRSLEGDDV